MMTHEEIGAAIERLRAIEPSDYIGSAVVEVVWAFMGGNVSAMELRDTIIALLEQADPDTHMELPKDADGEYIHIGDEVCGYNHPDGGVYCYAIVNPCVIAVGEMRDYGNSSGWALWNTLDVRHYHKPTVEDVLVAYYKECQLHASELGFVTDEGKEKAWRDIATAFADKLRKVMADDDAQ